MLLEIDTWLYRFDDFIAWIVLLKVVFAVELLPLYNNYIGKINWAEEWVHTLTCGCQLYPLDDFGVGQLPLLQSLFMIQSLAWGRAHS